MKLDVGMHIARCTLHMMHIDDWCKCRNAEVQRAQSVIVLFVVPFGYAGDMPAFDELR